MIYFVQAIEGGPVKIGYSDDVDRRRKELEFHYRRSLVLLATMEGGPDEEREIHGRFAHLRLGKVEQFLPAAELFDYIGRVDLANAVCDVVEMPACTTLIRVSKAFADTIRDASSFEKSTVAEFADSYLMPVVRRRFDDAIVKAAKKIEREPKG